MTRILCVEDNADNLHILHRRLSRAGFEVTIATDGAEGVAAATMSPPDLIVMDLNLPVFDGLEATRRLKAQPGTKHVPIIMLTADGTEKYRQRAMAAGCQEFEAKPVNYEQLIEKIRVALGPGAQP